LEDNSYTKKDKAILKDLWQKTKVRHNELEKEVVENYIGFLRQVAMYYLEKGRRVFLI
jgi:hypothetical protein